MTVYDKATEEKINALNRELEPFYLVDLHNGKFSLCACINDMEYEYGQAAFDAYAMEIGDDPLDEQGYITYGSGYDWQAAFHEAFKDDPNIGRVHFDSEGSAFFCDCDDLDILSDFGKRLRELSLDTEKFTPIVSAGIRRAAVQERLMSTVRGQLIKGTSDLNNSHQKHLEHKLLTASAVVDGNKVNMKEDNASVNALAPLTVMNTKGFNLPETGDHGTVLTTVLGIVAMAGAAAVIVVAIRKKKSV